MQQLQHIHEFPAIGREIGSFRKLLHIANKYLELCDLLQINSDISTESFNKNTEKYNQIKHVTNFFNFLNNYGTDPIIIDKNYSILKNLITPQLIDIIQKQESIASVILNNKPLRKLPKKF